MSDFVGEGFKPFPNIYEDNKAVGAISGLSEAVLERKVHEYWEFLGRDDIMPRARDMAHRILLHLGFEVDYRAGEYDLRKLEDETCSPENDTIL